MELSRWHTTRRGREGMQVRVLDVLTIHSESFFKKIMIVILWSLHELASLFEILLATGQMPMPKAKDILKQEAASSSISLLALSNRKPFNSASKVTLEELKLAVISDMKSGS
jgi:hypothetical protein